MDHHSPRAAASILALASIAAAAGLVACSPQNSGTTPGDSVLVEGAQHVIWKDLGGGLAAPPPAGAACRLSDQTFDLDVRGGSVAWSVCSVAGNNYTDPTAYSTTTGSRVLAADERAQAIAAAAAVTVSDRTTCGEDKDTLTLEVDAPSGSMVYGDDFNACQKLYTHYVQSDQIDQLGTVLAGMAHSP